MDDERHLFLRRANDNPPTYRVKYDGVEVGSISETSSHMTRLTFWQWGVDTMPLMHHGGRPPSGQALTLADAQAAFGRRSSTGWTNSNPASGSATATTRNATSGSSQWF
jgi:hypothetical protein